MINGGMGVFKTASWQIRGRREEIQQGTMLIYSTPKTNLLQIGLLLLFSISSKCYQVNLPREDSVDDFRAPRI